MSAALLATGYYFSGDGAYRDAEGNYQITGRVDDVINTKGHRVGTAELESCLVSTIWSTSEMDWDVVCNCSL